jgi:predicted DNA-binding transcriptional regulator AlpA
MTKTYSIRDLCAQHGISRQLYYSLVREGRGPKSFKMGRVVRITETAANEWIAQLEGAAA